MEGVSRVVARYVSRVGHSLSIVECALLALFRRSSSSDVRLQRTRRAFFDEKHFSAARVLSVKTNSDPYGIQIHHAEIVTNRAYFGGSTTSIEVDETWPENGAKALLESGYRLQIRPRTTLQDPLDARVVDSSEGFGIAEAHTVHCPAQVQHELPGDLATGVVGGHVGPFLRAFAGRGAERPGHDSSVDDTEGAAE
jgi:hypothetical protein